MAYAGIDLPHAQSKVNVFGPSTVSSANARTVCLKDAKAVEVMITCLNTTGVTGSAITLNQCTAINAAGAKALGFTEYYTNTDPANTSVFTRANAASNTFTTATTNSATVTYRIPIDPSTLDLANSFNCLQVGLANAVNTTVAVVVTVASKYSGNVAAQPNLMAN